MAEFEELRLTVTLIDNASTGLATLRQNLRALGGQENREALARMQKEVESLTGRMGKVREETSKTSAALTSLGRSAGTALTGLATAFISNFAIDSLKKFTDEVIRLDTAAKTFGVGGANLKALVDQMKLAGIDPNAAAQTVTNFRTAIAELSRQGSQLRQDLMKGAVSDPAAMAAFITRITGMGSRDDMAGAFNEFITAANNVFENELKRTGDRGMAAELRNRWVSSFKLDPSVIVQLEAGFKNATDVEEAAYKRRLQISKQFSAEMNKMSQDWEKFIAGMQEALVPFMQEWNKTTTDMSASWGKILGNEAGAFLRDLKKLAEEATYYYRLITDPKQTLKETMHPELQKSLGLDPMTAEQAEKNRKHWAEQYKAGRTTRYGEAADRAAAGLDQPSGELGLPSEDFDRLMRENDERIQNIPPPRRFDRLVPGGLTTSQDYDAAARRRNPITRPLQANPISYQGGEFGGARVIKASFGGDDEGEGFSRSGGGSGASMFKNAIRVGVFEGMVDFKNYLSSGGAAGGGGGGGGFTQASFQMPGGGSIPSNIAAPGGAASFGSPEFPNLAVPRSDGGRGTPIGSRVGPGTGPGAGDTPAGAPRAGGAAAGSRAQEAIEYFKSQGWSHEQAAGIAANLHAESGFKPGAVGDAGRARGIAQWHPDRQRAIERQFGKPLSQMSYQEQLAAVNWELNNGESRAGAALRGAKTASEAGAAVSRYYERPGNVRGEMAKRGAQAERFAAMPQAQSRDTTAAPSEANAPQTSDTTAPRSEGAGNVIEAQSRVAGIRKLALDPKLRAALDYASAQTGLTARVTSGGQDPHGPRTGSHRHNYGKAGDFNLLDEKGNVVSPDDPRALAFTEQAARAGVIGGGAGYMSDPNKIHLDIAGGRRGERGAYAGSRAFRGAMARGIEGQATFDRSVLDRGTNETRVTGTGKLSVDVRAPRGTKVDAEGKGLFKKTEIDRQTQMEPAQSAPRRGGGDDETIAI